MRESNLENESDGVGIHRDHKAHVKASDSHDRLLGCSVTEFADGLPLESIWDDLDDSTKSAIMDSIVTAIKQLHALDLEGGAAQEILEEYPRLNRVARVPGEQVRVPMGSLDLGFHKKFFDLFKSIITDGGASAAECSAHQQDDGSIVIESKYEDLGRVQLTSEDLKNLTTQLVLCHNDLEPRNVFVRQTESNSSASYELLAIIDWEMTIILPFAYEFAYKDGVLGSCNQSRSWYKLFKLKTADLLPSDASSTKLIQALHLIQTSAQRPRRNNVGIMTREKWLAYHRLEWDCSDVRKGWKMRDGEDELPPLDKGTTDALELEVLKELGYPGYDE